MSHCARPAHKANNPAHVTLRVVKDIPSLRRDDLYSWVRHSIAATNQSECPRLGGDMFRIVEFSVQSNHIHLVVEAEDNRTLASGMISFATRIARALNRALCRSGKVWDGRYHYRALTVPRDVRNALVYVLMNHFKHQVKRKTGERAGRPCRPTATPHLSNFGVDRMSSAPYFNGFAAEADEEEHWIRATRHPSPVHAPRTWLLCWGWRRHGLVKRTMTLPAKKA